MGLFSNDEANGLWRHFIKIGEVSSINPAMGTARVVFDDEDSVVSYDLPVLQTNTYANKDYSMPDVGEDVLCLFLPSGLEEGFILGSFYAGEIELPESNGNVRTVVFADGTKISYDRALHTLSATMDGTSIVANRAGVQVKAPEVIVNEANTVNIKGGTDVNVNAGSLIKLVAPSVTLTMGATTMKLSGDSCTIDSPEVSMTGNLRVSGDVIAGGVSLKGHTHPGDSGGTTGSPN